MTPRPGRDGSCRSARVLAWPAWLRYARQVPLAFHHLAVQCRDLELCERFYREVLGLPVLGEKPAPELTESLQHAIYQGFVAPFVLFSVLGVVIYRNRSKQPPGEEDRK